MFLPDDCVICVDNRGASRIQYMGVYYVKDCIFSSTTLSYFITLVNDNKFIEYSSSRFILATSLLKELA